MKYIMIFLFLGMGLYPADGQYHANMDRWISSMNEARANPDVVFNLDLSNQNLREVPKQIQYFTNLVSLKLSDNNLHSLDGVLKGLKNLEFIELSGNRFYVFEFSELAGSKSNLEECWLRNNNLRQVDPAINDLQSLRVLDLGANLLKEVPNELNLPALRSLNLDANQIKEMPTGLNNSPKLKSLNVSGNLLEKFELIPSFRKLKALDLSDNPIVEIQWGTNKSQLEKLVLDWLQVDEKIIEYIPANVEILSLEHCDLNSLEGLVRLRKLKELSILHNNIEAIPAEFTRLKKLRRLWITGNPIREIAHLPKKVEVLGP